MVKMNSKQIAKYAAEIEKMSVAELMIEYAEVVYQGAEGYTNEFWYSEKKQQMLLEFAEKKFGNK